jgi:hypothetical protein
MSYASSTTSQLLDALQRLIPVAPEGMKWALRATARAILWASTGLDMMGFHSQVQSKGIPFENAPDKSFNLRA